MIRQHNIRERFNNDQDTWPPYPLKHFMPLLLIHHQNLHSTEQAPLIKKGDITKHSHHPKVESSHEPLQENTDNCTATKELTEILAPLEQSKEPQFILIEGAPGIGKSYLLKEIAYRWGKKIILKEFKLVLLVCLHSLAVQQVSSVKEILELFCKRGVKEASEIAATGSEYFMQNDGKDLAFLFDGFDEYPEAYQKNGLIADILKRRVLPYCAIVVSSRPHATVHLREQATVRVDIWGFTELEQNQFIQQALQKQPQDIPKLTQYLEHHFIISTLCVVPFNMVVLLFLYEQGITLPNNSTELYNHFICQTIYRYLVKNNHPSVKEFANLTSLQDPYNKIIQQLSKLSLESLNNNKLVFSFDEIKAACPDIESIPGALNAFGLMEAKQEFGLYGTTITFKFMHLSIQEFFAAHYLTCLSPVDERKVLEEKFWTDTHFNMFAIYVTLTKGERPSFKKFIKPSIVEQILAFVNGKILPISQRFLSHQPLRCIHLYRCFEGGNKEICKTIEKNVFDNVVNLCNITLSPSDVESVALFLTSSSCKNWKKLILDHCNMQDLGLKILHSGLRSCDVTIETLRLSYNGLTGVSSSAISDITIKCRVNVLRISGNKDVVQDESFYSIIFDPSSFLNELDMSSTNLSSNAAIELFTALADGKKLKVLVIDSNNITDTASDAIINGIKKNTSLVELKMYCNPISGECAQRIVEVLQHNKSLLQLTLPYDYSQDVQKEIARLQEENQRKGCQVELFY